MTRKNVFCAVLRILNRLVPILHRLCSVVTLCLWRLLLFTLKGRMTPLGGRKTKPDFRNEKYMIKRPFFVLKQACAFRFLNAQIYHNLDPLFRSEIAADYYSMQPPGRTLRSLRNLRTLQLF